MNSESETSVGRYRKKPIVIEAMYFDGRNALGINAFTEGKSCPTDASLGHSRWSEKQLVIPTLEGNMLASTGDWIIKGIKGEFYPCKHDIFEATYETAETSVGQEREQISQQRGNAVAGSNPEQAISCADREVSGKCAPNRAKEKETREPEPEKPGPNSGISSVGQEWTVGQNAAREIRRQATDVGWPHHPVAIDKRIARIVDEKANTTLSSLREELNTERDLVKVLSAHRKTFMAEEADLREENEKLKEALRKWQAWTHITGTDKYPKDCRDATDAALSGLKEANADRVEAILQKALERIVEECEHAPLSLKDRIDNIERIADDALDVLEPNENQPALPVIPNENVVSSSNPEPEKETI